MKTILIFCGGRSDEHEISLISAKHILEALERSQYTPLIVGISKEGKWHFEKEESFYHGNVRADEIKLNLDAPLAAIFPHCNQSGQGELLVEGKTIAFDVAFPVLHGPFGEDGTIQGMFEMIGVPYVGANCYSSSLCMDKHLTKVISHQHHLPAAKFVLIKDSSDTDQYKSEIEALGFPLFVKPNRAGSSVGVSKVSSLSELQSAVQKALSFDSSCLIEEAIVGREVEVAVLGANRSAKASPVGEIVPSSEIGFYSYEGKYLLEDGAELHVPAKLSDSQMKLIGDFAVKAFELTGCDGMARVDMFYDDKNNKVYLNEVNTIPGFTPISMYPKLWAVAGLDYASLISKLIDLALARK